MNRIAILFILCMSIARINAQEIKVSLSVDKNKINRDTRNGVATVAFESSIKDLEIINDMGDERVEILDKTFLYLIQPETDEYVQELGYPRRTFILKTPRTSEYVLETPEIKPNTVTYYNVTLSNQFPMLLLAEYLFSKSSKCGVRLSFGKKYGGYLSYKWGEYLLTGNNIDNICTDVDLTNAKNLGFVRTSITAGVRLGILNRNVLKSDNGLYLLIGGGYGEYGRQWKNYTQIEGNVYFYTDYVRGFNGELALQMTPINWLALSIGADMLVNKSKVSVDYMLGIGICIDIARIYKKR